MPGPRRRSREIALQVLHVMDVSPELTAAQALARTFEHVFDASGNVEDGDDAEGGGPSRFDRPLVEALVHGFEQHRAAIDDALASLSKNWRVERMAVVERNIIRLALFELKFFAEEAPAAVVINEAVELAKRYGTAEGAAFVNGLLDRALTELQIRR